MTTDDARLDLEIALAHLPNGPEVLACIERLVESMVADALAARARQEPIGPSLLEVAEALQRESPEACPVCKDCAECGACS